MSRASVKMDEGTVELGECTYRVLVSALHKIAESDQACCQGRRRKSRHHPSCPVSIARRAMRDATRAAHSFRG